MMSNFFEYMEQLPVQDEYYIYDEQRQEPVKVVLDKQNLDYKYIVVDNALHQTLEFTPVDNKIEIKKEDGNTDSVCDALVTSDKRLSFIEIKDWRQGWKSKAKEQCGNTLKHFSAAHPEDKRRKQAYLCNVALNFDIKRPLAASEKEEKELFFSEYRARLIVGNVVFP